MRGSWIVGAAALLGSAEASPWNRDQGELLTISRYGYYEAEATERRFTQSSSDLYLEYGATDRLMAGAKLSYVWQNLEAATPSSEGAPLPLDALSGFAEASFFAQSEVRRWDGGVLSVMASAALPTETASRIGTDRAFARDAHAGISVLGGLDRGPLFATGRLGTEVSLGDDADLLRTEVTGGWHASGRTMLMLEVYDTRALTAPGPDGVDYDLTQAAPSLVLRVRERWRLQVGATVDLAGRNVDLGTGGFVALWVGE